MLSDLQGSSHLVDRRLHTFEPLEFDRLVLASGGKQKDYVQVGRESRTTAGLAPAKTPDKRDQMAKNWHDQIWRAFPSEILGKGETPSGGEPAVVMRADYFDGKKPLGWIELAKLEPAPAAGAAASTAPGAEYYARTEHTAGWVKLNSGAQLIADAQKLIAAP
jgi:hypothetical protein